MTRPTLTSAEMARAIKAADLMTLARFWRGRPPSGRFILHWMPKSGWCSRCGPVTRYHTCPATCRDNGFTCLPGCSRECNRPGVAG